ncbi:threonine/serine exporter family protein [Bacillus sp. EB01]|uniref:threonine/serine exporter family protein n=1 Tax=Bacillus sp. EB01 TaxID=1347086 RepID=UPI0005C69CDB|nr:threonine/serine exporter family protein [Bacillus sp. EB01]
MENQQIKEVYKVMDLCLLAGRIMLQSGAETYRVEDTMTRIAMSFGISKSHSYVTPTGIFFTVEGTESGITKLIRISERSTDLNKVALVNSISRSIHEGQINIEQAEKRLEEIEIVGHTFPLSTQVAAASLASGCFMIMFQGVWFDFFAAMVAGAFGLLTAYFLHKIVPIKFFAEFSASFVIGLISLIFVSTGLGRELDKIIIGSVMPLVPGLLLTNAVRDLISGHLVAGLSKGAEAFLTAFAIGAGIAVVLIYLS